MPEAGPGGSGGDGGETPSRDGRAEDGPSHVSPSFRARLYLLLEDPRSGRGAWLFSMCQMFLIVVSIVALVVETEAAVRDWPEEVWFNIELVCTVVFTVEYILRLIVAPVGDPEARRPRLGFALQVANVFDFLAILPFYIQLILGNANAQGLRVLRIVRLTRVFRVFKLGKYSEALMLITEGLKRSYQALQLMIFLMIVGMIIFASFFYLFEADTIVNNVYVFQGIPSASWFVFVTFTTAGFGDAYPVTAPGHFVAIITMLSGIVLLAMPISIIGQKFTQVYKELQRKNINKEAQAAELRVLLTTLCSIMREVHELSAELESANHAVMHEVVALAKEVAGVSVPVPDERQLSYRTPPDGSDFEPSTPVATGGDAWAGRPALETRTTEHRAHSSGLDLVTSPGQPEDALT